MIAKDINQINEEDLQSLIDNAVLEGKTIEYKQALPGRRDSDKIKFLADVSSFANASGGDLIYGITEDRQTGIPKSLEGLNIENVDQEILRLSSMIRDGIQPRILAVTVQPVPLKNSKTALIIRIPKSWNSPHRVIFRGHDKFYARSSNGKYPLDVAELSIAFTLSETITERIRNFRLNRISDIFANETPVPFCDNAKIILHLIPIISFNPAQNYDITKIASGHRELKPIYSSAWYDRYNLDGFLSYSRGKQDKSYSYVQLFRNGIIEAVAGLELQANKERLEIHSTYERGLITSLNEYLSILKRLSVEPPLFIFLTLLAVKGYSMSVDGSQSIDRDILLLPESIVESYDVRANDVLRPCFDSIWNACGFPKSLNYNEEGEWAPK